MRSQQTDPARKETARFTLPHGMSLRTGCGSRPPETVPNRRTNTRTAGLYGRGEGDPFIREPSFSSATDVPPQTTQSRKPPLPIPALHASFRLPNRSFAPERRTATAAGPIFRGGRTARPRTRCPVAPTCAGRRRKAAPAPFRRCPFPGRTPGPASDFFRPVRPTAEIDAAGKRAKTRRSSRTAALRRNAASRKPSLRACLPQGRFSSQRAGGPGPWASPQPAQSEGGLYVPPP